jgi:hypothetical protein
VASSLLSGLSGYVDVLYCGYKYFCTCFLQHLHKVLCCSVIDLHFSHKSMFIFRGQNTSSSWVVWRLRGPMVFILVYYCLYRWAWYLQAFWNCSHSYNKCHGIFSDHRESGHLFNMPSERHALNRAMSPVTALGVCDFLFSFDQRKESLLLALQHHFHQLQVSHPKTDLDQPCITSGTSQKWNAGWHAAGMGMSGNVECLYRLLLHWRWR